MSLFKYLCNQGSWFTVLSCLCYRYDISIFFFHSLTSSVGPGEDAKVKIYFTPTHSGLRKLVVDFNSKKLCHVKGYRNVIIGK